MSTFFLGEGNIGSAPEFQEFNSGNEEPRRLLRLNVYFDNPVPRDGGYEDRGGYWAPVELWHREAEHWSTLYQKGMRVLVEGRTVRDEWEDSEDNPRVTFKIEARRIGVLPHRLQSVAMKEKASEPTPPRVAPEGKPGASANKKSSRRQPQQPSLDVDG
ncbi:single-stranded DNA-binding protein [Pseudomonas aeruginosa]|uniref:single-stranded DNA-binding protein n=1 Tax=Pseudomonas aeruginosa TaxID=287 RepID=UPI00053D5983|nr:single-stranded DNA-binding protein [Pseudomonas aeruginosa]